MIVAETPTTRHNANGPRVGSTEAAETVTKRALGMCEWSWQAILRTTPVPASTGGVPMSEHPHTVRGEAMRRALLAIVRARAVAGLPLPPHRTMAAALGISAGQVTRHLGVLQDDGAYSTRIAGMHTRIVEAAA